MSLQDLKIASADAHSALSNQVSQNQALVDGLLDQAHALGVAAGQSGGTLFTQEQVDQMILNAVNQAKADLKAQVLAQYDAAQSAESAAEGSLRQALENL